MLALAHHYDELLRTSGRSYRARVYGQAQEDGMWGAWIVFFPVGGGRVIATDRETTQSTFEALSYWAAGLSPAYLAGALARAISLQPEAQLARDLEQLELAERSAEARAETLDAAASAARTEAHVAEHARERIEERLLETVAENAESEAKAHEEAAAQSRREVAAADRALRVRKRSKAATRKGPKKR